MPRLRVEIIVTVEQDERSVTGRYVVPYGEVLNNERVRIDFEVPPAREIFDELRAGFGGIKMNRS